MSEYMERHAVSRLIGAPPGYVGYEEGGQLTESVRRRPYSVILLDEVEKAHADVFNTLLQVLDDGRLTDGQGRTVNFTNTVIIMTSNLGSQLIASSPPLPKRESRGEGKVHDNDHEKLREQIMTIVHQHFRPEFLNRIDDIVLFHRIDQSQLRQIVDIQLRQVIKQLEEKRIHLAISDEAKDLLAREGYNPAFGARPLKRAIQNLLLDPLALDIIDGKVKEGDTLKVDVQQDKIVFENI
jgi:ATP-dependent Clp protease ATP-binding subunit ClpB